MRDFDNDLALPFEAGQVIHVPPGIKHAVAADKGVGTISVGGPGASRPRPAARGRRGPEGRRLSRVE
ncbi:MAG: hypothetical protein WDO24_22875 [Pseudomonadota bacterium]